VGRGRTVGDSGIDTLRVARGPQYTSYQLSVFSGQKGVKSPVLIIACDADGMTLEHAVAMFHLLGGGAMGDTGKPLPASRVAILPATSHTAVITQADLLHAFIEPFLKDITPKGMFAK